MLIELSSNFERYYAPFILVLALAVHEDQMLSHEVVFNGGFKFRMLTMPRPANPEKREMQDAKQGDEEVATWQSDGLVSTT